MSLHQLAQNMQRAGRGDDSMLVHMTPGEVHGLQALAMAHGGSLTINPHTGLPEAGWLSKLLPAVAGFALGPAGFGLMSALNAGLTVGGISALASGSLKEGLMAGIGAYGGANLGTALSNAAPASTASTAAPAASSGIAPAVTASSNLAPSAAAQELTAAGIGGPATTSVASAAPTTAGLPGVVSGQGAIAPTTGAAASQQVADQTAQDMLARHTAAMTADKPLVAASNAGTSTGASAGTAPSWERAKAGFEAVTDTPEALKKFAWGNKGTLAAAIAPTFDTQTKKPKMPVQYIRPYTFTRTPIDEESDVPFNSSAQMRFYDTQFIPQTPYRAPGPEYKARGGIVALATGGTGGVTTTTTEGTPSGLLMPAITKVKKPKSVVPTYSYDPVTHKFTMLTDNTGAPVAQDTTAAPEPKPATAVQIANMYASQLRRPPTREEIDAGLAAGLTTKDLRSQIVGGDEYINNLTKPFVPRVSYDQDTDRFAVEGALKPYQSPAEQQGLTDFYSQMNAALAKQLGQVTGMAQGGYADGGSYESTLGGYSDGGRLLRGPGDGVSDSIPAVIGNRQPARLADGEFVVPARIVSELGNGSTEAGAKKLYAMMDRVQRARSKSIGKKKVAVDSNADKHLPA